MSTILGTSSTTGLTEGYAASAGSTLSTGDLRRRYDFSEMVSELKVNVDPFFRFLSLYRKDPVDDTEFKYSEERKSWYKRYVYVVGHATTSACGSEDATLTAANVEQGDVYYWKVGTDFKSAGNIGNKYGQTTGQVYVGASGTRPTFLIPGLHLKIPTSTAYNAGVKDYLVVRIDEVSDSDAHPDATAGEYKILKTTVLRTMKDTTNNVELTSMNSATTSFDPDDSLAAYRISGTTDCLEAKRCYVVGNSFAKGSGYPDTWADNPYSTGYGRTQIFKTALGMDNSTRATVLKYQGNEFARLWGNKLLEHKWDIENALLFSTLYNDANGIQHTQGVVDFAVNYGHVFNWSTSKTCDNFLDDMGEFFDPRMQDGSSVVYFCDSQVYNWLNQISGYHQQNLEVSANFRSDFAWAGRGTIGGVAVNQIRTIYGDMNFTRNIHLDGSPVKILAVNLNHVKYRPLIGNGLNRDTAVYVGVQTLETTGIDSQVDLILTEAGLQCEMPEAHAVWTL